MVRRSVKKDIEETNSVDKSIISEFVNIALACSKLKKIVVEQERGTYDLRTNLNLFLYGQIGSTKSTLLKQIAKHTGAKEPFTDMSYPALIGSVDSQTKQLIVGASWECRNSLLLLDEYDFQKRKKDDMRALLQLIEGGNYSRKLASFSSPVEEIQDDLSYKFKNGTFNIQTRFSLIIATMKYPYRSQSMEVQALASRSVCLPWYPSTEELYKVGCGFSLFDFKEKTPKKLKHKIKKATWEKLLTMCRETGSPNFIRMAGDCVRVFVVEGKHREDLYKVILEMGSKRFG